MPTDRIHQGYRGTCPPVNLHSHSRPMQIFLKGFWAEWRVMGLVHACWMYISRWSCRFWPTPGMGGSGQRKWLPWRLSWLLNIPLVVNPAPLPLIFYASSCLVPGSQPPFLHSLALSCSSGRGWLG